MCKYLCLGISSYPIFIVVVIDELICCRMGHTEDLNPLGQTGEQPGAGPSMEKLRTDFIPESPGACWFMEDSTPTTDGVGGGERLATTADDSVETPGATMRAIESFEAGAADAMAESRAQRPTASEERATCPEMPQGVVGRSVQPPSP